MKAMKYLKYILVGAIFGILLSKGEAVLWYRIYEMFKFKSFHMYGIIGSAVTLGIILTYLIKKTGMKSMYNQEIKFAPKAKSIPRYLFGGIIFGLGWALTGACPGPMYILLGFGVWPIAIVLFSALIGTFLYGLVRVKLPH